MDGMPPFGLKRNLRAPSSGPAPYVSDTYDGPVDGSMKRNIAVPSVMHRPILTDPSERTMSACTYEEDNNYVSQRINFVAAARGDYNDFGCEFTHPVLCSLLPSACPIGLPAFTATELHIALNSGVSTLLATSGGELVDILTNEITVLCSATVRVALSIGKLSTVPGSMTDLEKQIKKFISLDVANVKRFCLPFQFVGKNLLTPGGLLEFFFHEWKRTFFDPLPNGMLLEKITSFIKSEIDVLDAEKWYVPSSWLQDLCRIALLHSEESNENEIIWLDNTIFQSKVMSEKNLVQGDNLESGPRSEECDNEVTSDLKNSKNSAKKALNTDDNSSDSDDENDENNKKSMEKNKEQNDNPSSRRGSETSEKDENDSNGAEIRNSSLKNKSGKKSGNLELRYLPLIINEKSQYFTVNEIQDENLNFENMNVASIGTYAPIKRGSKIRKYDAMPLTFDFPFLRNKDLRNVLYPSAFSLVMKLARLLRLPGGGHFIMFGLPSTGQY